MPQWAQRAVAEVSADVGAYGGDNEAAARVLAVFCPSRPSCCERASCQTWLLVHPYLEPPRGQPCALTGVLLRKHLGVKVEKASSPFLLLIQSAARWTFQLLTGNTSKMVHTAAHLFIPGSPCSREPAIPHQSQHTAGKTDQPTNIICIFRSQRAPWFKKGRHSERFI